MTTIVKHFENGTVTYNDVSEFICWVKQVYAGNEESGSPLRELSTYEDCLLYLMLYCDAYTVVFSDVLYL